MVFSCATAYVAEISVKNLTRVNNKFCSDIVKVNLLSICEMHKLKRNDQAFGVIRVIANIITLSE